MRKVSRKRKFLVGGIFIGIIVILVSWTLVGKLIGNSGRVVCKTQFGPCPEKYSQVLGATSDPEQIKSVLIHLPDVKSVDYHKNIFNTLEILINIRTPLGVVNGMVVDDSGTLFNQSDGSALPSINSPESYELGQTISPSELQALRVLGQVSGLLQQHFLSKLVDDTLFLTLDSGQEIVINVREADMAWSSPLQHILARSKIDGKAPRRIDLRFKDPVISF